jgi:peptide chain release factor 1
MKPFLRQTLDRQILRLEELDALLSASDVVSDMGRFRSLTREHAEASLITAQYQRLTQRETDLADAQTLLGDAGSDADMTAMAEDEITAAKADIGRLDEALQRMLIPKDPDDARPAFLELRAGAGGDESALFAADLFRMYTRYAERCGWRSEVISESPSELGGYKEVVLRIEGAADALGMVVYGLLRFE